MKNRKPRQFFVQAGWEKYRERCVPVDTPAAEMEERRQAFFAGCAILHETLMRGLSPQPGVTDDDMTVMEDLQLELDEFGQQLDRRYLKGN